jgi:2-C-methyl-D-erythritol 4-phosphate cytidylyltransferase
MTIGDPRRGTAGVVVPAAGSGRRLGGLKKAFLEVSGVPVLRRALIPFLDDPRVTRVVVALPPEDAQDPPRWLTDLDPRILVTAGGSTRSESVRAALDALSDGVDVIAVHDAARPFVAGKVVRECIDLALSGIGAVAGTPAVDTLKRVGADGLVLETPPRTEMWHAQTPQVVPAAVLRRAYAEGREGTDDSSLVEGSGTPIRMVDAGSGNFKVTHPQDVRLAEAVAGRTGPTPR